MRTFRFFKTAAALVLSFIFCGCAAAQSAFMVVNGLKADAVSNNKATYFSAAKDGKYKTLGSAADAREWRTLSLKYIPRESGNATIELFSVYPKDADGKEKNLGMYFDDFTVNGKNIDNGNFESGLSFWRFNREVKSDTFMPSVVYGKKTVKSGNACALVFDRKRLLVKTLAVQKDVPLEISVSFRRADFPEGSADIPLDLKPFANADFIGATHDESSSAPFKKFKSKVGLTNFKGVDFQIINPDANDGKSVVKFGCRGGQIMPNSIKLNFEDSDIGGRFLYVLHTASNPAETSEWNIGDIVIETSDGVKLRPVYIQHGVNISDCMRPEYPNYCLRAYTASKKKNRGALFITRIPLPSKSLKSIEFSTYRTRLWSVFAATVSNKIIDFTDGFAPRMREWDFADIPQNCEIIKGSALDLSRFLPTGVPAGKLGRVEISERGGLCFSDDKGRDLRFKSFSGWSVVGDILKLESDPAAAKAYARRYAELVRINGYNLIRIYLDPLKNDLDRSKREARYDLVDYFFSELKKNGVYIHLPLALYDIGTKNYVNGRHDEVKIRAMFGEREARAMWRETALEQLARFNKYTGMRWCDDPVFLCVEFYNELCISMGRIPNLPADMQDKVRARWGAWLEKFYGGSLEKLRERHSKFPVVGRAKIEKFSDAATDFRNPDWVRFMYELDREFMANV